MCEFYNKRLFLCNRKIWKKDQLALERKQIKNQTMIKSVGASLDKILQRVKFRPSRTESPLSYNVMNPLANIQMAIEMIEAKNTDADIKLYVDIIKRNCATINQLINEVLPGEMPFILQDKSPDIRKTAVNQEY